MITVRVIDGELGCGPDREPTRPRALGLWIVGAALLVSPALDAGQLVPDSLGDTRLPPYRVVARHRGAVMGLAWNPTGERLISGDMHPSARISSASPAVDEHLDLPVEAGGLHPEWPVRGVAWSPRDDLIVVGQNSGAIRVFDAKSGSLVRTLAGGERRAAAWSLGDQVQFTGYIGPYRVEAVAWSPDGKVLAAGAVVGRIRLWDARTGTCLKDFDSGIGAVGAVSWAPGGVRLAAAGSKLLEVWNTTTHEREQEVEHPDYLRAVSWRCDGEVIATGGYDGVVRIWRATTGQLCGQLARRSRHVTALAWRPGHKDLAVSYGDGSLVLHADGSTRDRMFKMGGPEGVQSLAWSPDGTSLAVGCADGTIRLIMASDLVGSPQAER